MFEGDGNQFSIAGKFGYSRFGVGAGLVSTEKELTMIAGQGKVTEAPSDMNFTARLD